MKPQKEEPLYNSQQPDLLVVSKTGGTHFIIEDLGHHRGNLFLVVVVIK